MIEDDLKGLGEAFHFNPKLTDVKLLFRGGEHFATSIGLREIVRGLAESTGILEIWLDFREGQNSIGDVGVRDLGAVMKSNKEIQDIKLWFT